MRPDRPAPGARRAAPWRACALAGALLVAAAASIAALHARAARHEAETGGRHFDGRAPLVARIAGHEAALPPSAAACANCHAPPTARGGAAGGPAETYGPTLDRASLTGSHARRGGPPSRFDEAAFCRTLRTGVDPAGVMLPRTMPRYAIDDETCRGLWTHLVGTARR